MILRSALLAGAMYFGLVFALGFVFGIVRTAALPLTPGLTRFGAVLIELPVMLIASWFVCAALIARCGVRAVFADRAAMGGLAFALLETAELALSVLLLHATPAEHVSSYAEPSRALGLAAQAAFGVFPIVQLMRR